MIQKLKRIQNTALLSIVFIVFFSCVIIAGEFEIDGHFIVGKVLVPLGDGTKSPFTLHVQRHKRGDNKWTDELLVLNDGRKSENVFADMKSKWQTFYQDMIDRGMPVAEVKQMLKGITGDHERAGVWVLTGLSAAGYSGGSREIGCSPNVGWFTIAHESMHGWHWGAAECPVNDVDGILFQDLFTQWANYVYHTRINHPEMLEGQAKGRQWKLDYLNYSLQNDAEWLANTFAGWLYSPEKYVWNSWQAIKKSAPDFENFFNCLWKDGKSVQESYAQAFGPHKIKHPQYWPTEGVPPVHGFTKEDSTAIWKVCTDAHDKSEYIDHFNSIVRRVAPNLPGSPADYYELGYGDANHDGTTDWIATYVGPGPTGLGNGKYLWNKENTEGAYTFIVSGRKNDMYAEYKQDPYLTLSSMNRGSLAQPWYREWQGEYGSCNGASLFKRRRPNWIDEYLKDLY